jgi:predicted amidohydrolase YtcJ
MPSISRKDFLGLGALLAGATALPRALLGAPGLGPGPARAPVAPRAKGAGVVADLAILNGVIWTGERTLPTAQALAIKDGRFLAVGSTADVRNIVGAGTRVIDAAGRFVCPGFIDAHNHPSGIEELYSPNANVRSIAALQAAIRPRVATTPPGMWIDAFLFDDTKLTDPEPLARRHLDAISTAHPIAVHHRGGHTVWFNSKAFELAGITRDTPDPIHGRFFRDANGELTGRSAESANDIVERAGRREQFTPEQARERARAGMAHMSKLLATTGLTSVHDAGADAERLRAYADAREDGALRHRVFAMVTQGAYTTLRSAGVRTGFGDEWFRIGGLKLFSDGSASERTMRMSTPYAGTSDFGIFTITPEVLNGTVEEAHRAGWRVGTHANGDVAIAMVLDAYERVQRLFPVTDRRHRIEHCTLVTPELVARIKAAGVIPTPFWTYVYYHGEKWAFYGEEKLERMFAHRAFLDAGIPVAGASDYPPGPFEPLMALQSMVTRTDYRGKGWGLNQRISVEEALTVATINGAHNSHEESTKGSIVAGKYGDCVVLDRDPRAIPAETIKDVRVHTTITGGRVVFEG